MSHSVSNDIPLGGVNLSLAADKSGVTATATTDGGQGEDDLLTTVDVSVENTEDVLEASLLRDVKGLERWGKYHVGNEGASRWMDSGILEIITRCPKEVVPFRIPLHDGCFREFKAFFTF